MLCATFCLVLQWLAAPAQPGTPQHRDHDGATEVPAPASEPAVAPTPRAAPTSQPPGPGQPANPEPTATSPATSPTATSPTATSPTATSPTSPATSPTATSPTAPATSSPATASSTSTSPAKPPAGEATPKWWGPFPRPKVTGFGGPTMQLTGLDGKFAAMVGLAGGLTIKRRVSIGATAMWLLNPADAGNTSVGAPQRLNFNFGGLLLAVVFARTQRVDFTVEGMLGGGGACLQNPNNGTCYARTAMFIGQPGLAAHIKLAPIVRLSLGLGYRLVAARGWTGPTSRQLGAPVGSVLLEFGLF